MWWKAASGLFSTAVLAISFDGLAIPTVVERWGL